MIMPSDGCCASATENLPPPFRVKQRIGVLCLFVSLACCQGRLDASLMAATATDLAGGTLVTFEAPNVGNSNPYTPTAQGVTFSTMGTSMGEFVTGTLGWEGALHIAFDAPVIATHWIEETGVTLSTSVELFSDDAFTNSLGVFDITGFRVNEGSINAFSNAFSNGFISSQEFSSMKLLGATSSNIDDFRYAAIPEPSSLIMMALVSAGAGVASVVRRYRSSC